MGRFLRRQTVAFDDIFPASKPARLAPPVGGLQLPQDQREWRQRQHLLWDWQVGQAWLYFAVADRQQAWWGLL